MTEEFPDQTAGAGEAPEPGDTEPEARPLAEPAPPTGDDRVDGAVAGLRRLPGLPPEEHVAVLEEVHGQLRDILGELSEDPAQDRA